MTGNLSSIALAWLLTYAIHSTVLLSLAWLLMRVRRWTPAASELLWKSAMLGGILTATVQLRLDLRPAGTVVLQPPAVAAPAASAAPIDWPERPARLEDSHTAPITRTSVPPVSQSSVETSALPGIARSVGFAPVSPYPAEMTSSVVTPMVPIASER